MPRPNDKHGDLYPEEIGGIQRWRERIADETTSLQIPARTTRCPAETSGGLTSQPRRSVNSHPAPVQVIRSSISRAPRTIPLNSRPVHTAQPSNSRPIQTAQRFTSRPIQISRTTYIQPLTSGFSQRSLQTTTRTQTAPRREIVVQTTRSSHSAAEEAETRRRAAEVRARLDSQSRRLR